MIYSDLDQAQDFLKVLQDFIKKYPEEFDIVKLSEFIILTKPIMDGNLNDTLVEDLNKLKDYTSSSKKFVNYFKEFQIDRKAKKLAELDKTIFNIKQRVSEIKRYMQSDPNSLNLEKWLANIKDAENALKDLNSYDELLETDNKLKRIIEDKEEIYRAKVGGKKTLETLKNYLKEYIATDKAEVLLKQVKYLEDKLNSENIEDIILADNSSKELIEKEIEPLRIAEEKASKENKVVEEKAAKEKLDKKVPLIRDPFKVALKEELPFIFSIEGTDSIDNCGIYSATYVLKKNNKATLYSICSDTEKVPTRNKATRWIKIHDDKINIEVNKDWYEMLQFKKDHVDISWNSGKSFTKYNYSDVNLKASFLSQKLGRQIDKSLGGYKGFYFDMNLAQVEEAAKEICPAGFKFLLGLKDTSLHKCLSFRGELRKISLPLNDKGTLDRIIINNVDSGSDTYKLATYFSENKSGFAIYDEIVDKFMGSSKYEFIRYPTKKEIEKFNTTNGNDLLYNRPSLMTIFKNKKTSNLVILEMAKHQSGYYFDINYLSPGATSKLEQKENSKTIKDDDL